MNDDPIWARRSGLSDNDDDDDDDDAEGERGSGRVAEQRISAAADRVGKRV